MEDCSHCLVTHHQLDLCSASLFKASKGIDALVDELDFFLHRPKASSRVVMCCGPPGSGKSTLSKAIARRYPSFTLLSIDRIIFEINGLWGVDFLPSRYPEIQKVATNICDDRFVKLLKAKQDIVLDRSFWSAQARTACYTTCKEYGADHLLVHLWAEKDFLLNRVRKRRETEINADSAVEVTEEMLERYLAGFERPSSWEEPALINAESFECDHTVGMSGC